MSPHESPNPILVGFLAGKAFCKAVDMSRCQEDAVGRIVVDLSSQNVLL